MSTTERKAAIKSEISRLLEEYYSLPEGPFDPSRSVVALGAPTYDGADVADALAAILEGWPTKGPRVERAEERAASMLGTRHAVMVSSGGAANLLALYLFSSPYVEAEKRLKPGDEVITPAVTWATTVSPIIQIGCVPVLVDVHLGSYDLKVDEIERNITERTRALMIVHALGHPCDMDPILEICRRRNLVLIEDACESLGARYGGRYVGGFGEASTLSFYFSHHLTSVEGGMVLTDSDAYADVLRSMRANGWFREIKDEGARKRILEANEGVDSSFLFPYIGFNLKPTDVAAGLLHGQFDRLADYIAHRTRVARRLLEALKPYEKYLHLPGEAPKSTHSWFNFALVIRDDAPFERSELTAYLNDRRIQTRPIIAGNIAEQPFLKDFPFRTGDLTNAGRVMRRGFFIGCHQGLSEAHVDHLAGSLIGFFRDRGL